MYVGSLTNAVGEELYIDALAQASIVDARILARRAGTDKSIPGVLEGIPMSVKDCIDQRGVDTTCGLAVRCSRPSRSDGLLVSLLRDAGAIPFVRTSVPQMLMSPECMNAIWGVASNPYNSKRTPGGSSGGEGALLAARGSVLGIGSDIGGSLRIPAHFCGLYAFKPTPQRITLDGLANPALANTMGQSSILPVAGPMARSVDDLIMVMKAWLTEGMWKGDVTIPRVPLDESVIAGAHSSSSPKLTIGYYESDGWFPPAPACARAVRQAVAALEGAGHTCVRWQPPSVATAVRIFYGIMTADGAQSMLDGLEGEDPHEYYADLMMMMRVPRAIKSVVVTLLRQFGELRAALLLSCMHPKSSAELFEYHAMLLSYTSMFTSSWQKEGFDAVISPGFGLPAFEHGQSKELSMAASYTFLYNVLHFPVGAVPIGVTEEYETKYDHNHDSSSTSSSSSSASSSSLPTDRFSSHASATVANSVGMPIGVQVAALPYHDEVVLRVMKELERTVGFKHRPAMADQQLSGEGKTE